MSGCTAILLAGARPGTDPLAATQGTDLKPLVRVGGVPMVRRPAEVLLASPDIDRVRVLTNSPERMAEVLPDDPRLAVEPSAGTIAATLEAIAGDPATRWPLLVTTADHALLSGAMIAEFLAAAHGADLAAALVERSVVRRRFPDSRRTWIHFRRGSYTGANLFLLGSPRAMTAVALWRQAEQQRKSGRRLLRLLGPVVLVGTALRLLTIDQVARRVGRRLGLGLRAIALSDPLAAIDVDTPSDLDLVERILGERE